MLLRSDVADCSNVTAWGGEEEGDPQLADTPVLVAGSIVFLLVLPLVLFEFRPFPIGTTSAVLLGGMLMVLTQVVSQDEVYTVLGHKDNLTTIFLLLGMMLLSQYFEREQLLERILGRLLQRGLSFENYLWRVCLLAFILSALFTNDVCAAVMTPLLLRHWNTQGRRKVELETMLLAIATSSNIGSVTTIFGNPQMALIAAKTSTPPFTRSLLDLRYALGYLGPPAVMAYFVNLVCLILHYRLRLRGQCQHPERSEEVLPASDVNVELTGEVDVGSGVLDNELDGPKLSCDLQYGGLPYERHQADALLPEDDLPGVLSRTGDDLDKALEIYGSSTSSESSEGATTEEVFHNSTCLSTSQQYTNVAHRRLALLDAGQADPLCRYRSLRALSLADLHPPGSGASFHQANGSRIFRVCLLIAVSLVIVLFLASSSRLTFDMGLVPVAAAIFIMTSDALINRQNALHVMQGVDWSIILMFFGIFVWMHGLNKTRVPHWVWRHLHLGTSAGLRPPEIATLAAFIAFGSNIFSNVPLTILVLEQLVPCGDQQDLVLYLAWCATVAGNLTLFGSVANLIVAQKGRESLHFTLTFSRYFRYGFPTTLLILTLGILMLYGSLAL